MVKKTPFYEFHKKYNAKMSPFAGYEMPIQYPSGIIKEHLAVRNSVGMFDLSHMGEFEIYGEKRLKFVQSITTNDVSALEVGQIQYSAMCYYDGGIVDDLLVYRYEDHFLLVVNASNIEKDWKWVDENLIDGVEVINKSDDVGLIAIQGPKAEQVAQKLVSNDLSQLKYYHFIEPEIQGIKVLFSRTGYTGEDGFEIYLDPEHAEFIWQKVEEAGKEFNIIPIGLGARDTLRLEMKFALYGNDMTEKNNPIEVGLGWIVKFDKGFFIGRDVILKVKQEKPSNKLVAFLMSERGVPRPHYKVFSEAGEEIGEVRSGTHSPSLKIGVGTAFVKRKFSKIGREIFIEIHNKKIKAQIVKPPFYKNGTVKINK